MLVFEFGVMKLYFLFQLFVHQGRKFQKMDGSASTAQQGHTRTQGQRATVLHVQVERQQKYLVLPHHLIANVGILKVCWHP